MSTGARSKALYLGIQSGKAAEDEGWGEGQPKITVMGRELRVMRRWGYEWQDEGEKTPQIKNEIGEPEQTPKPDNNNNTSPPSINLESQETIKADPSPPPSPKKPNTLHPPPASPPKDAEPPLWALNLETLRSTSNTSPLFPSSSSSSSTNTPTTNLPIHDPTSARNYILKSFATAPSSSSIPSSASSSAKTKKSSAAKDKEEKEHNLALLLHALDLLYASWIDVIGAEELD
ncbi:MAG: hypothetical protein Q9188_006273, partial [Gyalolechia gomerana]